MKLAKPIEIIRGKGKHRVDTRVFAARRRESYCMQPGCRFRGKLAAQGVCWCVETHVKGGNDYLERAAKAASDTLAEIRALNKTPAKYLKALESHYVCAEMNAAIGLDEQIRMRARVRIAEDKLARLKRARKAG